MGKIEEVFSNLKSERRKALIPYISCGDPTMEFTESLILGIEESGADIVELGIPYSDPVADGPTIQKASQRALAGDVTLEKIFVMLEGMQTKIKIPLIIMTYYNPIYRYGVEKFISRASRVGIGGLIVPDLPLEEADELKQITVKYNIDLIFLVAPTSTSERIERIAEKTSGFMYCVSVTGVTGSRREFDQGLDKFLTIVRSKTQLPLAVGFGISNPKTAAQAAQISDGIIVGSSVIERIENNLEVISSNPIRVVAEVCEYLKSLRKAIDDVSF